jgi:hypothetical protein
LVPARARTLRINRLGINRLRINRLRINRLGINRLRINRLGINRLRIHRLGINRLRINRLGINRLGASLQAWPPRSRDGSTSWSRSPSCSPESRCPLCQALRT